MAGLGWLKIVGDAAEDAEAVRFVLFERVGPGGGGGAPQRGGGAVLFDAVAFVSPRGGGGGGQQGGGGRALPLVALAFGGGGPIGQQGPGGPDRLVAEAFGGAVAFADGGGGQHPFPVEELLPVAVGLVGAGQVEPAPEVAVEAVVVRAAEARAVAETAKATAVAATRAIDSFLPKTDWMLELVRIVSPLSRTARAFKPVFGGGSQIVPRSVPEAA